MSFIREFFGRAFNAPYRELKIFFNVLRAIIILRSFGSQSSSAGPCEATKTENQNNLAAIASEKEATSSDLAIMIKTDGIKSRYLIVIRRSKQALPTNIPGAISSSMITSILITLRNQPHGLLHIVKVFAHMDLDIRKFQNQLMRARRLLRGIQATRSTCGTKASYVLEGDSNIHTSTRNVS